MCCVHPLHDSDCTGRTPGCRRRVTAETRGIRFTKYGLGEDPTGLHVLMPSGALREVYAVYWREGPPAAIMLCVRSFNREIHEELAAGAARVLNRQEEN